MAISHWLAARLLLTVLDSFFEWLATTFFQGCGWLTYIINAVVVQSFTIGVTFAVFEVIWSNDITILLSLGTAMRVFVTRMSWCVAAAHAADRPLWTVLIVVLIAVEVTTHTANLQRKIPIHIICSRPGYLLLVNRITEAKSSYYLLIFIEPEENQIV